MLITRRTPSGRTVTLDIPCTPEQFARWESGVLIQNAMPQVPAPLREFLTSGIPPDEWAEMEDAAEDDAANDACPECARSNGPRYRGPCPHGWSAGE